MIAFLIRVLHAITDNYLLTIVICSFLAFSISIPLDRARKRNAKRKEDAKPKIREIMKKYNANALGVSEDNEEKLAPEVRALSKDKRDEKMGEEIEAEYNRVGYRAFTGWIPTALIILVTLLLIRGLRTVCPLQSIYNLTFIQAISDVRANLFALCALIAPISLNLIKSIIGVIKAKKTKERARNVAAWTALVLGTSVSAVIMLGLTADISIGLFVLIVLRDLSDVAFALVEKRKKKDGASLNIYLR